METGEGSNNNNITKTTIPVRSTERVKVCSECRIHQVVDMSVVALAARVPHPSHAQREREMHTQRRERVMHTRRESVCVTCTLTHGERESHAHLNKERKSHIHTRKEREGESHMHTYIRGESVCVCHMHISHGEKEREREPHAHLNKGRESHVHTRKERERESIT